MLTSSEQRSANAPRLFWLLFALGVLASLTQLFYDSGMQFGPNLEVMSVARSLVRDHAFANPFMSAPTGPTAHLAPVYPAIVAGALWLFGDAPGTAVPLVLLAAGLCGLHAALLPVASRRWIGSPAAGTCAALLAIALPVMQLQPQWEAMPSATASLALCLLADWAFPAGSRNARRAATVGFAAGLALLLNPSLVLVLVPLHVWLCVRRRLSLGLAGLTLAVSALVCLPWVARNYAVLGGSGFIRNNLGLELYVSNNDCAQSSLTRNLTSGCSGRNHPNHSRIEAQLVMELGEPAYNRSRLRLALGWIRNHPAVFLALTARRGLEFWFPDPHRSQPFAYGIWLVTALSFIGLWQLRRHRVPAAQFFWVVVIVYPLLFYLIQSSLRYRYPIFWISLLGAGYFLAMARRRMKLWHRGLPIPERVRQTGS